MRARGLVLARMCAFREADRDSVELRSANLATSCNRPTACQSAGIASAILPTLSPESGA